MRFDVGDLPAGGSVARSIMDWSRFDVLMPGESPQGDRKYITYRQAQDEVTNLLKSQKASHQYLTYEAAKLCGKDPAVQRYTLHLIAGSVAEDYVFATGESLADITIGEAQRMPRGRRELSDMLGHGQPPSFIRGLFHLISSIWRRISGNDTDAINRPYFAHFYEPRREGSRGLEILGGELKFQSARDRAVQYWHVASNYYRRGDMPRAFCALGHLVHLVQDLHVPAHVHNDIHGPTILLGKLDSLEEWCAKADYLHIARRPDEPNMRIWNSKPLAPPRPDASWDRRNLGPKLEGFMKSLAVKTQRFRSVDYAGTGEGEDRKGKLGDGECFDQARELVPSAISKSAWLLVQFLDFHRRRAYM